MSKYTRLMEGATVVDISSSEGGYNYYGAIRTNGEWIILRENTAQTEYRYKVGAGDYLTNWTGRTDLTYGLRTIG